jgi:hypothetical protein
MIFRKMFILLSFTLLSFASMGAEIKFPVEKTISVVVDAQTLVVEGGALQISIPELKDDLQGQHQGGKLTAFTFDNVNFIRHLVLKEAEENNKILEANVVIKTELIRTPQYNCPRKPCPFCDEPVCTPNGQYKETIEERVSVDILGLIFFSKETLPIKSDQ